MRKISSRPSLDAIQQHRGLSFAHLIHLSAITPSHRSTYTPPFDFRFCEKFTARAVALIRALTFRPTPANALSTGSKHELAAWIIAKLFASASPSKAKEIPRYQDAGVFEGSRGREALNPIEIKWSGVHRISMSSKKYARDSLRFAISRDLKIEVFNTF